MDGVIETGGFVGYSTWSREDFKMVEGRGIQHQVVIRLKVRQPRDMTHVAAQLLRHVMEQTTRSSHT